MLNANYLDGSASRGPEMQKAASVASTLVLFFLAQTVLIFLLQTPSACATANIREVNMHTQLVQLCFFLAVH